MKPKQFNIILYDHDDETQKEEKEKETKKETRVMYVHRKKKKKLLTPCFSTVNIQMTEFILSGNIKITFPPVGTPLPIKIGN